METWSLAVFTLGSASFCKLNVAPTPHTVLPPQHAGQLHLFERNVCMSLRIKIHGSTLVRCVAVTPGHALVVPSSNLGTDVPQSLQPGAVICAVQILTVSRNNPQKYLTLNSRF
jgi:hypothetical protein